MVKLQYKDGIGEWMTVSEWENERIAWMSLGYDNRNYRTVDPDGNVLTNKSKCDCKTALVYSALEPTCLRCKGDC